MNELIKESNIIHLFQRKYYFATIIYQYICENQKYIEAP